MKTILIIPMLCLTLVMACKNEVSEKSAEQEGFKFKVRVVKAEIGTFQKDVNYKGTVMAWQTANIMPEVSGRIAAIYKDVGDQVNKGELLALLDLTALKLQQKQAEAALRVSEKGHQDARLNVERLNRLFEKNAVSSFQLEKAQLALTAAETQLESSRAACDIVRYNIDKSHMRAPFAGVVSARNLSQGDMVNPMMGTGRPVIELLDVSKVKVIVDLNAEDMERIHVGKTCRVQVGGLDGEIQGTVYSKSLVADPVAKSFRVEIEAANEGQKIRANVFADVWIEVDRREEVIALPLSALLQDRYLMVVEGGKAKRIEIRTGQNNGRDFIVEDGVTPGQLVIVEGNYDLQEGQEVVF